MTIVNVTIVAPEIVVCGFGIVVTIIEGGDAPLVMMGLPPELAGTTMTVPFPGCTVMVLPRMTDVIACGPAVMVLAGTTVVTPCGPAVIVFGGIIVATPWGPAVMVLAGMIVVRPCGPAVMVLGGMTVVTVCSPAVMVCVTIGGFAPELIDTVATEILGPELG